MYINTYDTRIESDYFYIPPVSGLRSCIRETEEDGEALCDSRAATSGVSRIFSAKYN